MDPTIKCSVPQVICLSMFHFSSNAGMFFLFFQFFSWAGLVHLFRITPLSFNLITCALYTKTACQRDFINPPCFRNASASGKRPTESIGGGKATQTTKADSGNLSINQCLMAFLSKNSAATLSKKK